MIRDEHVADGPWRFDDEVTEVFDDMLRRSIPLHSVMREAVADLAERFLWPAALVVDLGASRGEALHGVLSRVRGTRGVAVEVSPPMLGALVRRFDPSETTTGEVSVVSWDLREGYPPLPEPADVTLCVLTLQFVPIEYRQRLLRDAYRATRPGGALIVVEKVLGAGQLQDLFVEVYHRRKLASGYTHEQVERKRLALEGVLVPLTASANESMLQAAGWRTLDCFWRWLNFAGWIATKEE